MILLLWVLLDPTFFLPVSIGKGDSTDSGDGGGGDDSEVVVVWMIVVCMVLSGSWVRKKIDDGFSHVVVVEEVVAVDVSFCVYFFCGRD